MDYFTGKWHSFKQVLFRPKSASSKKRKITRFELYGERVYDVLAWKDTGLTLKVFLAVNFAYWIFVSWHIKVYGAVFLALLVFVLGDGYFESKHPNGYESYISEDYNDFRNAAYDMVQSLIKYRKENHFSFCFCNSIIFFIVYVISRSIPDYILLYLAILAVFFLPLGFLCLPEETAATIKQTFLKLGQQAAEDELIPFLSHKKFDSQDELDTQDSFASSLGTGVGPMPSYLDVDNDSKSPSFTPTGGLTDSDTDSDSDGKAINFHSKHFNGSSSSDEELARGLRAGVEGFTGMLSQLGPTILSSMAMTRSEPPRKLEHQLSSSESEFEMINDDDMDEPKSVA